MDEKSDQYTYISFFAESNINIDGVLDENAWKNSEKVALKFNETGEEVSDSSIMTWIRTCYDEQNIYIAFECNDPDIWTSFTKRDEHLWEDEVVEVFIDVDNVMDTYVEIEVSPANVLFDSYIVDPENIDVSETSRFDLLGIRTNVRINGTLNERGDKDESWTVEIAVPFKDLSTENTLEVNTQTEIKINFFRSDENRGMKPASYAWSPTGGRFHKPSVFGKLKFN